MQGECLGLYQCGAPAPLLLFPQSSRFGGRVWIVTDQQCLWVKGYGWGLDAVGWMQFKETQMNFSDLSFANHVIKGATIAQHTFDNDWKVSVVSGPEDSGLYGNIEQDTFEVAIIRPDGNMLDDVINWQTPVQITTLMRLIAML